MEYYIWVYLRGDVCPLFFAPKSGLQSIGLLLIALCLYVNLWVMYARSVAAAAPTPATTTRAINTGTTETPSTDTAGATTPGSISLSSLAVSTGSTVQTTGCTVAIPYVSPTALDVLSLPDGLTVVIDTPYTYALRASTLSGLRAAVTLCAARIRTAGDYHAITARQLTWTYTPTPSADGSKCSLTNVRVGLHIAQFLPALSHEARLSAADMAAWNTYETNLHLHESGHVAHARRYAQELTEKLQSMSTLSCSQLKTQAELTTASILTTLNTEDTLYDAETGHGATQGALL